jgi:hypothetical protein
MSLKMHGYLNIETLEVGLCPVCQRSTIVATWSHTVPTIPLDEERYLTIMLGVANRFFVIGYTIHDKDPHNKTKWERRRWGNKCHDCGFEWDHIHGN